jgi:histidine triad (HIT) family protein
MALFENIRDGQEPATIIYKDEFITAFDDKYPVAPVHILIIPNKRIKSLDNVTEQDEIYMGKLLVAASKVAKIKNIHESGYRLITNCNKDGGQEIDYLHFHLVGGVPLGRMIGLPKESKKIFQTLKLNNEN